MRELNMGVQGAKRSRYYPASPDALLRKLVEQNPDATEEELEEAFRAAVAKCGPEIWDSILAYWYANRYRAVMREMTPASVTRARKAAAAQKQASQVAALKTAAVAKVARTFLDQLAPACGKRIGEMTKADCEREGGWYMRIASKLKPRQTVAQARLTDAELYKLYDSKRAA